MPFQKGHPYLKKPGFKHSEETKSRMSQIRKKNIIIDEQRERGKLGAIARWRDHVKITGSKGQKSKFKSPHLKKTIDIMHEIRFGGNRELALTRDNYSCVICRMTNEEHKEKWRYSITVDHIDGRGRNSKNPNHALSNLQTLCLRCHGKKDSLRYRQERSVII